MAVQPATQRIEIPGIDPSRVEPPGPADWLWNGAIRHRPQVVVRAGSAADVRAAVLAARDRGLPLSVRSGGHDWAGRAIAHDGLVIDLRGLARVEVDAGRRRAVVGGGASAADVIRATAGHGLVAATGTAGSVGYAGLTLGGGYGPLLGVAGLALDNVLAAEVVLADGRIVTADADREPELYWAIRGGGGNFGVVTALTVALHPLDRVLAGFMFFDGVHAEETWLRIGEHLATTPDELTVQTGILTGPDGRPALLASPTWSGDLDAGTAGIERLQQLGPLLMSQVAPMPYLDLLGLFDSLITPGRYADVRTRTFAAFTPPVVAALVASGPACPSPLSGVLAHHFHGAATRVAAGATAFGRREPHFVAEIVAMWDPSDRNDQMVDVESAPHRAWTRSVSDALEPHARPGGYANLIGPAEPEQARAAYGDNAARLLAAKRAYDPDGLFRATPLPF